MPVLGEAKLQWPLPQTQLGKPGRQELALLGKRQQLAETEEGYG